MSTNQRLDTLEANIATIADALGMPDRLRQRPNGRAAARPVAQPQLRDLRRRIERTTKLVHGISRAADQAMNDLVILSDMLDELSPRPVPTDRAKRS